MPLSQTQQVEEAGEARVERLKKENALLRCHLKKTMADGQRALVLEVCCSHEDKLVCNECNKYDRLPCHFLTYKLSITYPSVPNFGGVPFCWETRTTTFPLQL